jgi:very-short-patch-repair endonuclease
MTSKKRPREHPYSPHLKESSKELRGQPTPAEKKFWNSLRKMPLYETTVFNRQKPIGNYIADFYCHRFQLVIEIDGNSHGSEFAQNKDSKRTEFLESQGLTVLRFTNREVEDNVEAVMVKVEAFIGKEKGKSPQPPSEKGEP